MNTKHHKPRGNGCRNWKKIVQINNVTNVFLQFCFQNMLSSLTDDHCQKLKLTKVGLNKLKKQILCLPMQMMQPLFWCYKIISSIPYQNSMCQTRDSGKAKMKCTSCNKCPSPSNIWSSKQRSDHAVKSICKLPLFDQWANRETAVVTMKAVQFSYHLSCSGSVKVKDDQNDEKIIASDPALRFALNGKYL
jgi:hypothetical protein